MDLVFWGAFGAGFSVGWGVTSVVFILARHYERTRGYDHLR